MNVERKNKGVLFFRVLGDREECKGSVGRGRGTLNAATLCCVSERAREGMKQRVEVYKWMSREKKKRVEFFYVLADRQRVMQRFSVERPAFT